MKKMLVIGGIAALFIFSLVNFASAKTADGMIIKKQEQKTGKVTNKVAKKKAVAKKPVVQAAPKRLHQAAPAPRARFKYIKVQASTPWYFNIWTLFFGGSSLLLLGGIIGSISRARGERRAEECPSQEEDVLETEKVEEPVKEDWLKKFFGRFWKPKASCQSAV